jgi:hypothetical protein
MEYYANMGTTMCAIHTIIEDKINKVKEGQIYKVKEGCRKKG